MSSIMDELQLIAGAPSSSLQLIIAACSILLGIMWVWRKAAGAHNMPPGPGGLPILGYLHKLGALPHHTFARLSKIYGPLMCVRLGRVPLLVASSPDMASLILDKSFAGRPVHIAPSIMYGGPNILFSQPGPYWKLMRQIFTTDLLTSKRLGHFRPVRAHEMRGLLLSVLAARGSPLCIRDMLHTTINNTISTMALGKPLHQVSADPNVGTIVSTVMEIVNLIGQFNWGDYIPYLAWMDLQGYGKRSKEIGGRVRSVLQAVIDRRRRCADDTDSPAAAAPRDLLDLLLAASADAKHKELNIGDDSIRAVLLGMFIAGSDTASITIEWALAELLANPKKLGRVQEELDEVVGRERLVEEGDLANLPYLRAVVNEALRLHPPTPLLAPHRCLEACQVGGYRIPAHTLAFVNIWAIHRDPKIWANPLDFCPERFLPSLLDVTPGQHFGFLPFGSGRRSCPGWKLGLLNAQNVLAHLLHAFDWITPTGKPPPLNEKFGLTVAIDIPLIAVPMARLPMPLYGASPISVS